MAVPWFVAPPERWSEGRVTLERDESHHAVDVLKITAPDVITVTDGSGRVARCAAPSLEQGCLVAEILDVEERRRLKPEIVVYQGAAKGRKLDDAIERLAELGVAEVWTYSSARSVVRWDRAKTEKAVGRWRSIARSATKLSRSAFVPSIGGMLSWSELLRRLAREDFTVALWEEASLPLRTALTGEVSRVAFVVGPEGGLAREEAEALADAGAQLVSLGPRILRTENAGVVGVSSLLFHYGLIG